MNKLLERLRRLFVPKDIVGITRPHPCVEFVPDEIAGARLRRAARARPELIEPQPESFVRLPHIPEDRLL
jgi:hypothetical protein